MRGKIVLVMLLVETAFVIRSESGKTLKLNICGISGYLQINFSCSPFCPYLFFIVIVSGSCDVDPAYRSDCGWVGIDEDGCKSKGCCWDSSIEGKPYCYFSTDGAGK